jgi:hypothetical protein
MNVVSWQRASPARTPRIRRAETAETRPTCSNGLTTSLVWFRRITEIGYLLVGSRLGAEEDLPGPEDGTVVTLRFADGTVSMFRVVAITEEVPEDRRDEVLTVDRPLGRALAGRRVGDTITYGVSDSAAQAEVVAMQPPSTSG